MLNFNDADFYHAFNKHSYYLKRMAQYSKEKIKNDFPELFIYHASLDKIEKGCILYTVFTSDGNKQVIITKETK